MKKYLNIVLLIIVFVLIFDVKNVYAGWDCKPNSGKKLSEQYCVYKNIPYYGKKELRFLRIGLDGKTANLCLGTDKTTFVANLDINPANNENDGGIHNQKQLNALKVPQSDGSTKMLCPVASSEFSINTFYIEVGMKPDSYYELTLVQGPLGIKCLGDQTDKKRYDSNKTEINKIPSTVNSYLSSYNSLKSLFNKDFSSVSDKFTVEDYKKYSDLVTENGYNLQSIITSLKAVYNPDDNQSCSDNCGIATKKFCSLLHLSEIDKYKNQVETIKADVEKMIATAKKWVEENSPKDIDKVNDISNQLKDAINNLNSGIGSFGININNVETFNCEGMLDEDLIYVIRYVNTAIRIAVPIILIVLVTIDFGQAVISQDDKALKVASSRTVKRVIAAIVIFFIPMIVDLLLNMDGVSDWVSDDPTCSVFNYDENVFVGGE